MKTPAFWSDGGWPSVLLRPAAWLYRAGAGLRRAMATPWPAPVPVICIGNVTAGGAGKTPVALALGRHLVAEGAAVHFVSRGYGGAATGPLRVQQDFHTAAQVGDEPLLLAAAGPAWIAANRAAAITAAADAGADVVVMDDGFQNPSIAKDLSVLVFDGGFGLGNGQLLPAGPLREPLAAALRRADAAVIIGDDTTDIGGAFGGALPVHRARIVPGEPAGAGTRVFAFAGIGRPAKFFQTLTEAGYTIAGQRAFADHHPFTPGDLAALRAAAEAVDAILITTEKDLVRIAPDQRTGIAALTITLQWDDDTALERILEPLRDHGPDD